MIVDDEKAIGFALAEFFKRQGWRVDCAFELEEAQAMLVNYDYDAVIADLRLTGVCGAEGLEVIRHVREHCPTTKTMLLTAYSGDALEAEARGRGVDLVVRKPRPLDELGALLSSLVESPTATSSRTCH